MADLAPRLRHLRVVLVEPRYDGNLGKVARAMRNFGLSRLTLVGGRADPNSEEARWYSRDEAADVLDAAERVETLGEALSECKIVVGTSRRAGRRRGRPEDPEELFEDLEPWAKPLETALVFGREAHGLSTPELDLCHRIVFIPSDDASPSLNLSHAVGIVGYELYRQTRKALGEQIEREELERADHGVVEAMFEHARRVWLRIGYLHYQNPEMTLRRWRHLFARAGITELETRVVRALLHQTEWVARVAGIPEGGVRDAPAELFDKHSPPEDRNGSPGKS